MKRLVCLMKKKISLKKNLFAYFNNLNPNTSVATELQRKRHSSFITTGKLHCGKGLLPFFLLCLFSNYLVTFVLMQNKLEMQKKLNYFVLNTKYFHQQHESPVKFHFFKNFIVFSLHSLSDNYKMD